MKKNIYLFAAAVAFGAAMTGLTSCSEIEMDSDAILDGVVDTCDDLDDLLYDTYAEIITDYADNISKYEKGAEAEFSDFTDDLTITYPYDYVASGVVSGLFGDLGDILVMAGDQSIKSKSKSDVEAKIRKNLDMRNLLVYIALVQREGSLTYCFETSGFDDKEIEFSTKNLKSILADVDYRRIADGYSPSASSSRQSSAPKAQSSTGYSSSAASEMVSIRGKIGGKYPVAMEIDVADNSNVTGRYRYTSSGSGDWLSLRGRLSDGTLSLNEYNDKGECSGTWTGDFMQAGYGGYVYTGTFTNYAGKSFSFDLSD